MISPQNYQPGIGECLGQTITKHFDEIDNCLEVHECIPRSYEYELKVAHSNVPPIHCLGTTSIDIHPDRYYMYSMENSFIYIEQDVPITIPSQADSHIKYWYVGYLISIAAIFQYTIDTNTDQLIHNAHANYEWLIVYNSYSDEVKNEDPNFYTDKKIREMNPFVPGVYIDVSKITENTTVNVKLKLKIPLKLFLLYHNLKWYPEFLGKTVIKLTPSYRNIIVAPVIPQEIFSIYPDIQVKMDAANNDNKDPNTEDEAIIDFSYHQLNMPMRNRFKITRAISTTQHTITDTCSFLPSHKWICNRQVVTKCEVRLAKFMVQMNIYNNLQARFLQMPFLFPVQLITVKDFTMPISDSSTINTTMTVGTNFVDSCYTVFKENDIHSTMKFPNIGTSYQFLIQGDYYPRDEYNTIDDPRSINMTFDALNVNNSSLTSISKDMRSSMQPYTIYNEVADNNGGQTEKYKFTTGCRGLFSIGIPFCDSNVFQGGMSTGNNTIQISLRGNRRGNDKMKRVKYGQPVTIFVSDILLEAYSQKPMGRPQMRLPIASVESLVGRA